MVRPATLLKKTLAQLFFCEFSKTFKDTFFTEHLRTITFEQLLEINQHWKHRAKSSIIKWTRNKGALLRFYASKTFQKEIIDSEITSNLTRS